MDAYIPEDFKVAANAIVGGTASELGGGKFANGAISGAMVFLFNQKLRVNGNEITVEEEITVDYLEAYALAPSDGTHEIDNDSIEYFTLDDGTDMARVVSKYNFDYDVEYWSNKDFDHYSDYYNDHTFLGVTNFGVSAANMIYKGNPFTYKGFADRYHQIQDAVPFDGNAGGYVVPANPKFFR